MDKTQAIQVYCRLKPLDIQNEKLVKYEIKNEKKPDVLSIIYKKKEEFKFKKVFDENTTQSSIFKNVAVPILDKFLSGMNGTIFTYGQTGSGKTHTMYGTTLDRGIIPRSFEYIFENSNSKNTEELEMEMSYIEIYNEVVYDLLPTKNVRNKNAEFTKTVNFTVNKKGKVDFKNLNVFKIKNIADAFRLLRSGNAQKKVSSTFMNFKSSRSHCICRITYAIKNDVSKLNTTIVLNLVDLAGSECISKSNNDKKTLTESRYINVSLFHLHQVINSLGNPIQQIHVPYRNSVITMLLKGSLGFNCSTAMIITVVLNQRSIVESISTCKYARNVSGVKHIILAPTKIQQSVKLPVENKVNEQVCKICNIQINVPSSYILNVTPTDVKQPHVMESGDGIRHNLQMAKVDSIEDNVERAIFVDEYVQTNISKSISVRNDVDSIENQITKVNLIGDNDVHTVRDEKCRRNFETQTVVLSSNVGVMADMQCDDITNDIKVFRCGWTSVYRKCLFLLIIIALIFMEMWKHNPTRFYSTMQNLMCLKPDLSMETIVPECRLPTGRDPAVGSSTDCGDLNRNCRSCSHHSNLYSKMTDDKNADDFETEDQDSKQKRNTTLYSCIVFVILISMLLYKQFHLARIHELNTDNADNDNINTQTPTPLKTKSSTADNTAPVELSAHQINVSQCVDEKPLDCCILKANESSTNFIPTSTPLQTVSSMEDVEQLQSPDRQVTLGQYADEKYLDRCILKDDENSTNLIPTSTSLQTTVSSMKDIVPVKLTVCQAIATDVVKTHGTRNLKFVCVANGIWQRNSICKPTLIQTESRTEDIIPVELPTNQLTVGQCADEKYLDRCILKDDENSTNIIPTSTSLHTTVSSMKDIVPVKLTVCQAIATEVVKTHGTRNLKFVCVANGIWQRNSICKPTLIQTESRTEDIIPVELPTNQLTVGQCADEKYLDRCILKVDKNCSNITHTPTSLHTVSSIMDIVPHVPVQSPDRQVINKTELGKNYGREMIEYVYAANRIIMIGTVIFKIGSHFVRF